MQVLCVSLCTQYALAQLRAASSSSRFGPEALQEQRRLSYPAGKLPLQEQVVLLAPGTATVPHSLAAHMAHAPVLDSHGGNAGCVTTLAYATPPPKPPE
ncbi:hypothetical protein C0995_010641 [Termitomyces sp. Mi166|nr:hypothetical protein C0995_010641 [Termitomyces sp. Mi166\